MVYHILDHFYRTEKTYVFIKATNSNCLNIKLWNKILLSVFIKASPIVSLFYPQSYFFKDFGEKIAPTDLIFEFFLSPFHASFALFI